MAPHPVFQRQGADIYVELEVGMVDAILGSTVRVPTVDGALPPPRKPRNAPLSVHQPPHSAAVVFPRYMYFLERNQPAPPSMIGPKEGQLLLLSSCLP